ncbi:DUF4142 domain-containing protein [Phenylobacterium sp.]|jgi:putative membrane protein|uniref:DUF4142 domain-containing protein n=1 Tax=Phenylobacterium sp. TaxID=1871053 RepID=UPI002F923456
MKMIWMAAAAACAFGLTACASGMDGGASSAMNSGSAAAAAAPTTATAFLAEAARSDMYEIQSSQLAQTRGSSQAVKDFAAQMIRDHTNSTQMVMEAARAGGMTPPPPPPLDARRRGMLDQLRGASGPAFDRMYVSQQLMAHQEALALHSGYAQNGDNAALRGAAGKIAPIVQQHLSHVQGMQPG